MVFFEDLNVFWYIYFDSHSTEQRWIGRTPRLSLLPPGVEIEITELIIENKSKVQKNRCGCSWLAG